VVAQVDEDHAAVVAPGVDPAAQHDIVTDQGLVDETTIIATHGKSLGGGRSARMETAHAKREFAALQTKARQVAGFCG
jgi:hypothetical protein